MVLKTSGLIPQWCIDLTMAAFRHRIQDLRSECDRQIHSDLTPTYNFSVFSTFEMSQMVVKTSHNLRSKTARSMMILAGDRFSPTLKYLCYLDGSKLVGSKEEPTSKTF
jgi:putative transposase